MLTFSTIWDPKVNPDKLLGSQDAFRNGTCVLSTARRAGSTGQIRQPFHPVAMIIVLAGVARDLLFRQIECVKR